MKRFWFGTIKCRNPCIIKGRHVLAQEDTHLFKETVLLALEYHVVTRNWLMKSFGKRNKNCNCFQFTTRALRRAYVETFVLTALFCVNTLGTFALALLFSAYVAYDMRAAFAIVFIS